MDRHSNQKRNKNRAHDGVVYDPSSRRHDREPEYSLGKKPAASRKPKGRPHKSQFALFYIITLMAGVIICIVIFAVVYSAMRQNRGDSTGGGRPTPSPTPHASENAVSEMKQFVGIITHINPSGSELRLTDIDDGEQYRLAADAATSFQNKYAREMIFAELRVGDIVSAAFNIRTNVLSHANIDATAWDKKTSGVVVDPDQNTVTIGNERYFYDDRLIALHNDTPINIAGIRPMDTVTMRGYRDRLWFIELNRSHGVIEFINGDNIKDATVQIGATILVLDETNRIEMTEGAHRVVVQGANVEPYSQDVFVTHGQTQFVDLSVVQFKSSVVTFTGNTDPDSYRLFINEREHPANQPVVLDFGTYEAEVRREGHLPWRGTVDVQEPAMTVTFELVREVSLRRLTIETEPPGAAVYIDNGYIGISPVSEMLADGSYTITVKLNGYHDTTAPIVINENTRLTQLFIMRRIEPFGQPDAGQTGAPVMDW